MLKNFPLPYPFTMPATLVRRFGADVDLFASKRFQGHLVLGHTGLDLAAAPQTPVLAVQDGTVLRARTDAEGFGAYVLLAHEWGQTLYAQLTNLRVQEGAQVAAGTVLGEVRPLPPTLTAVDSHLHFGLRIRPYSTGDGWAGFSDPLPYLERLVTPRGPIIGPHIIAGARPHLPTLAQWQPRQILILDPHPDEMRELRAVCPNSVIVARLYHPEHEIEQRIRQNARAAAEWAHERVRANGSTGVDY